MRAFIAIELPEFVHDALHDLQVRLRESGVRASWVKQGNIHLTLRFLGEIDDRQVALIIDRLERGYAGVEAFRLRAEGAGAFPNARKPSVLWAGCGPLEGPLAAVQEKAERAARAAQLKPETRKFRPHLTIARVRDWRRAGAVAEALERAKNFDAGEFSAGGVALFSSKLTPTGAIYERLREFRFSC